MKLHLPGCAVMCGQAQDLPLRFPFFGDGIQVRPLEEGDTDLLHLNQTKLHSGELT